MSNTTCLMSRNEPPRGGVSLRARRTFGGRKEEAATAAAILAAEPSNLRRVMFMEPASLVERERETSWFIG